MEFIVEPAQAAEWSATQRRSGHTVGFVPTMGALHAGHMDLIARALAAGGRVACSIFVNPLQFNSASDLENYPRTLEADRALLAEAGCHMLFAPTAAGLYAHSTPRAYDLGGLDSRWEGSSRPGHFQGVVNVVERLFHAVRPDRAYFGEKDRQQLAIIRHANKQEHWPVHIVPCPTLRAPDGLALSSRNQRLSPAERAIAPTLHSALQAVAASAFRGTVDEALAAGHVILASQPAITIDHLALVHPETLLPLTAWGDLNEVVVLVAATLGPVRLIDNITLHR